MTKKPKVIKCKQCGKKPAIKIDRSNGFCTQACRDKYNAKQRARGRDRYPSGESLPAELIEYYNYKLPLKQFKGFHGYLGTVASNKEKTLVQCHFCGLFWRGVNRGHIVGCKGVKKFIKKYPTEKIETVADYKRVIQLQDSTVLIGEQTRAKLISAGRVQFAKNIAPKLSDPEYIKDRNKRIKQTNKERKGKKMPLEKKNKTGTCPDQLLEKIKEVQRELGHVPSKREFVTHFKGRYVGAIYATFGNWANAMKKAGFIPASEDPTRNNMNRRKYTREQLIEAYQKFFELNDRTPSYSDHRRGLLPSEQAYQREFGTINNAREAAGVPRLIRTGFHSYIEVL